MTFFKLTSDRAVRRLRWVMVAVTLFDFLVTILGQPSSYWQNPETAKEGNPMVRVILHQGHLAYFTYKLVSVAALFLLASITPKRLALAIMFALIFGHFWGASTWLRGHFGFGFKGPLIYSIVLGIIVVFAAFPAPRPASGIGSNTPD